MPLQSADDGVLAAMGRPYTWRGYRAAVAAARRRLPGLALSTDLIVGFPAEDDAAFARSLAAIAPGGGLFARVHVFSYSPRTGTPAAALAPLPRPVARAVRGARGARGGRGRRRGRRRPRAMPRPAARGARRGLTATAWRDGQST